MGDVFSHLMVSCVVSICHSFRSMGQPGRINGFDRCFQVVDLCAARRHRVTPVLAKTQMLKFYQVVDLCTCACKDTNFELLSAPYGVTKALQGNYRVPFGDY